MNADSSIRTHLGERGTFAERFQRDGVLIVEQAFDESGMAAVEAAFQDNIDNPGPLFQHLYPESGGTFIQSVEDSSQKTTFKAMFAATCIAEICADVFGSGGVWYFHDQLFFKEGGQEPVRRTPWHQDTPYHLLDGGKFVVFWIAMQDVSAESALEVVRGSHKEVLYNPSFFDPSDDTLPLYAESDMPRLPDIELERENWDIVTCPVKRGDVLIFHPSCLHGGAPQAAGTSRRSLSLRMLGDDVLRVERPGADLDSPTANNVGDEEEELTARIARLAVGTPIYQAGLNQLC